MDKREGIWVSWLWLLQTFWDNDDGEEEEEEDKKKKKTTTKWDLKRYELF